MESSNPHIGSLLEAFLKGERLFEDVTNFAAKSLLDPANDKVQPDTAQRAAAATGRKAKLELV